MKKICQSCGMPLEGTEFLGTNKDGSLNEDYCKYCYEKGEFTSKMTMEEMVDFCVPFLIEGQPELSKEEAKKQMMEFFPQLKRWKNN